jgi:hypothetical protein
MSGGYYVFIASRQPFSPGTVDLQALTAAGAARKKQRKRITNAPQMSQNILAQQTLPWH